MNNYFFQTIFTKNDSMTTLITNIKELLQVRETAIDKVSG